MLAYVRLMYIIKGVSELKWIKINLILTWINEMQIEHVFANVKKGMKCLQTIYYSQSCMDNGDNQMSSASNVD